MTKQIKLQLDGRSYGYQQLLILTAKYTKKPVKITDIEGNPNSGARLPKILLEDDLRLVRIKNGRFRILSGHSKLINIDPAVAEVGTIQAYVYSQDILEAVRIGEQIPEKQLANVVQAKLGNNPQFKITNKKGSK
jgi:hypothetical protein